MWPFRGCFLRITRRKNSERPSVVGVSIRGGTVLRLELRLERDAWSLVKGLLIRQATHEYPPPLTYEQDALGAPATC